MVVGLPQVTTFLIYEMIRRFCCNPSPKNRSFIKKFSVPWQIVRLEYKGFFVRYIITDTKKSHRCILVNSVRFSVPKLFTYLFLTSHCRLTTSEHTTQVPQSREVKTCQELCVKFS